VAHFVAAPHRLASFDAAAVETTCLRLINEQLAEMHRRDSTEPVPRRAEFISFSYLAHGKPRAPWGAEGDKQHEKEIARDDGTCRRFPIR
jgi:hypothetical protein